MPFGNGSKEEVEQRQQAALKHGAYAFRDRGEQALEPGGRTRLAELREQVQDRQGVIELAQEKCADSVLLFEIVQSYVAGEVKKGTPLVDIPALKVLPAFMNSMQRALATLLATMPKDSAPASAELERIQKVIDDHDKNTE
jgi:hypothetical protein